jgi:metal-responsive CopG/Arc/MetJ family transcriptional regulator
MFLMAKEETKDFILRLPVELFKRLEREVKIQKTSRTRLVRKALCDYLNVTQSDRDLVLDLFSERAKEVSLRAKAATQG